MGDLISRQAAIDAAVKGADPYYADSIKEEIDKVPSTEPDYTMRCSFCDMSICTLEGRPCSRKVVKE